MRWLGFKNRGASIKSNKSQRKSIKKVGMQIETSSPDKLPVVTGDDISEEEKNFIEFLTDYIITSDPGYFTMTFGQIDQKIKNLPKDDPLYKYRMKFGNLDELLKQSGTETVLYIDGNSVRFNDSD